MTLEQALLQIAQLKKEKIAILEHSKKGWNQASNTYRQLVYERETLKITDVHQTLAKANQALTRANNALEAIATGDDNDDVETAQYALDDIKELLK